MLEDNSQPKKEESNSSESIKEPITVKVENKFSAIPDALEVSAERLAKIGNHSVWVMIKGLLFALILILLATLVERRQSIFDQFFLMYMNSYKRVHEHALETGYQNAVLIRTYLSEMRVKVQADRVALFQFHNGTNPFKGQGWVYFDQSAEDLAPGVISAAKNNTQIPYYVGTDWMPYFFQRKCTIQLQSKAEKTLSDKMKNVGTKVAYLCPVFLNDSKISEPAGFITASFIMSKPSDYNQSVTKMQETAKAIGKVLNAESTE